MSGLPAHQSTTFSLKKSILAEVGFDAKGASCMCHQNEYTLHKIAIRARFRAIRR